MLTPQWLTEFLEKRDFSISEIAAMSVAEAYALYDYLAPCVPPNSIKYSYDI